MKQQPLLMMSPKPLSRWSRPTLLERHWENLQLSYYWDVEILGQLVPDLETRLLHECNYWETISIAKGLIQNTFTQVYRPMYYYLNRNQGVVSNFWAWSSPLPASRSSPCLSAFLSITLAPMQLEIIPAGNNRSKDHAHPTDVWDGASNVEGNGRNNSPCWSSSCGSRRAGSSSHGENPRVAALGDHGNTEEDGIWGGIGVVSRMGVTAPLLPKWSRMNRMCWNRKRKPNTHLTI